MLLEAKPKTKMAFSIENLAKSSHDEKLEKLDYNNSMNVPTTPDMRDFRQGLHYNQTYDWITPPSSTAAGDVGRLTPESDPGYRSLYPTPSKSNSGQKRKRCESGDDSDAASPLSVSVSRHPSESSFDSLSPCTPDSEDGDSRRKKARTAFTTEQVATLEARYQTQKYLPATERNSLAAKLKLSDQQVKTWFQNRRMKEKRQQKDDEQSKTFSLPTGGVDIAQLHALGLPCPPPFRVNPMPFSPGSPSFNMYPGVNQPTSSPIPGHGLMGDPRIQLQYPGMQFGFHPMGSPVPYYPGARKSPNQMFGHLPQTSRVRSPNNSVENIPKL